MEIKEHPTPEKLQEIADMLYPDSIKETPTKCGVLRSMLNNTDKRTAFINGYTLALQVTAAQIGKLLKL